MSEWVGGWVSGWVSEWVSECVGGRVVQWVGESVDERVGDWVGGWLSGWVIEWVGEWVNGWLFMKHTIGPDCFVSCLGWWTWFQLLHYSSLGCNPTEVTTGVVSSHFCVWSSQFIVCFLRQAHAWCTWKWKQTIGRGESRGDRPFVRIVQF